MDVVDVIDGGREMAGTVVSETASESLLTTKELARTLRVTPTTIHDMVDRGCPVLALGPRSWRFCERDVMDWIGRQNRSNSAI